MVDVGEDITSLAGMPIALSPQTPHRTLYVPRSAHAEGDDDDVDKCPTSKKEQKNCCQHPKLCPSPTPDQAHGKTPPMVKETLVHRQNCGPSSKELQTGLVDAISKSLDSLLAWLAKRLHRRAHGTLSRYLGAISTRRYVAWLFCSLSLVFVLASFHNGCVCLLLHDLQMMNHV